MKNLTLFICSLFITLGSYAQTSDFYTSTTNFLGKHVTNGKVNYTAIKANSSELDALIAQLASIDYKSLKGDDQKSFLINAYNLSVIKGLVDAYPTASPMAAGNFFGESKHTISGEEMSLTKLEKTIIFGLHKDARLHFVLVCGAVGCPPLISQAYIPSTLETQLDAQTKSAMDDPNFTKVDETLKKVKISQLFQWYNSDFTKNHKNAKAYINAYRSQPIPEDYKVDHYKYDWAINDKASTSSATGAASSTENNLSLSNFTPSSLLTENQIELKIFNSIYTQNSFFDETGAIKESNQRSSYFSSLIQVFLGTKKNFNWGFDGWVQSVYNDSDRDGSPLKALGFPNDGEKSLTSLTTFGPKFKIAPFKNFSNLSFQMNVFFQTHRAANRNPYLAQNGYLFWLQTFYVKSFGTEWQLFLEQDIFQRVGAGFKEDGSSLNLPFKAFISYFPHPKTTLYTFTEYNPSISNGDKLISSYFLNTGIGAKYQLTPSLIVEGLYSNFWKGSENVGAGRTFNIGFRILK